MSDVIRSLWMLLALAMSAANLGCGATPKGAQQSSLQGGLTEWSTSIYADHPLVGQVWSSEAERFVTPREVATALGGASPLLLGERHDHPDHHRIQAWIISQLKPGAIVGFEMLDEDDAKVIGDATDPASLRDLTKWDKSGWPKFPLYAPIFEVLFKAGHSPLAIHPARRRLRALMMGPSSQESAPASQPSALSEAGLITLKADIDESHCGYASPTIVAAMVKAQEFKDRWMSAELVKGTSRAQRVVIAGNGHVRKDYGLPNHLPNTTKSVGILEVKKDVLSPKGYHPARYDYIWFTPRLDTLNACDKYKKALEKMKKAYEEKRKAP